MRTDSAEIIVPVFPRGSEWLNSEPLSADELIKQGPLLVEFWDFARINSLRTLPYMQQWQLRYGDMGLNVVGVHTPGFTLSHDPQLVKTAVTRIGVEHPVLLDTEYSHWHDYGNRGWPARYLWSAKGRLKYWHYGEGDYDDCELAIQESLVEDFGVETPMPPLVEPVHATDVPGLQLPPQSADIAFPDDIERVELLGDWNQEFDYLESTSEPASISVAFDAGAAFVVAGGDAISEPGCIELEESDNGRARFEAPAAGTRVYGFQFTPKVA